MTSDLTCVWKQRQGLVNTEQHWEPAAGKLRLYTSWSTKGLCELHSDDVGRDVLSRLLTILLLLSVACGVLGHSCAEVGMALSSNGKFCPGLVLLFFVSGFLPC